MVSKTYALNAFLFENTLILRENAFTIFINFADETLIVVTADHSHAFVISGYPKRGNPIFGLVDENSLSKANDWTKDKFSYTTLGYMNGPGAQVNTSRDDPAKSNVKGRNYLQQSLVPLSSETHGGEDVGMRQFLLHKILKTISAYN